MMSKNKEITFEQVSKLRNYFDSKVNKSRKSGCWNWSGYIDDYGYGQVHVPLNRGKKIKAHRLSWFFYKNPQDILSRDESKCVLHKCDNRRCVNPEHLFMGTRADNVKDMRQKGRQVHWQRRLTKCLSGHPLTKENTRVIKRKRNGKIYTERQCKTCSRARVRSYYWYFRGIDVPKSSLLEKSLKGTFKSRSKLTDEQKKQIELMAKEGPISKGKIRQICTTYNVCNSTVMRVLEGENNE